MRCQTTSLSRTRCYAWHNNNNSEWFPRART